MTDADWGIPPGCSFNILIQFKMSRIVQFVYNSINLSHSINRQSFQLSHFQIHVHFCNIILKIYSCHIIISDFICYTTKTLEIRIEVSEQTEVVGSSFLPFDLGPRLGDPHPSLVNNNHATLSG